VRDGDKLTAVQVARDLVELGFTLLATRGTAGVLKSHGIQVTEVNKVAEGRPHIVDMIKNGDVSFHRQHRRGDAHRGERLALDPHHRARAPRHLLHHHCRREGGLRRHEAHGPPRAVSLAGPAHAPAPKHDAGAHPLMKTPMTTRGAALLREELHHLKTVERPANSQAIGERARTATCRRTPSTTPRASAPASSRAAFPSSRPSSPTPR
jgi:hypothetical protein